LATATATATATLDGIQGIDSNAIAIGTTAIVDGPRHRSKIVGRWVGTRRLAVIIVIIALAGGTALALKPSRTTTPAAASKSNDTPALATTGQVVGGSKAGAPPQAPGTAQWVVDENNKPGATDWRLPDDQRQGDIEGYADKVSIQPGDSVTLFVSTIAQTFHVEGFRMGWYNGAGARLIFRSGEIEGEHQKPPTVTTGTNMVEADWKPSLQVKTDATWPPGVYLFKLVGNGNQQQYIVVTMRDDTSHATYVIQNSVTTWQAYNLWGGYDLYEGRNGRGSDFDHRARIVSFDRPYKIGDGSGDFLGSEYPLVALAESLGLDITYSTNVDVEERPELLLNHKAFLSLGHDEYWSTAMRDAVEAARDHGVNLAFLGANAVFRHIRLADAPSGKDRRIIDYKSAAEDPITSKDKSEATVDWREPPVNRPESTLIGNLYECNPVKADMVVANASNWLFLGTGLSNGDHLDDVVGSEYDRYLPGWPFPPNVELLTHSPLKCRNQSSYSDATYYSAPSGAGVFASGTNLWISKLDPGCTDCPGPALIRITENLLEAFAVGPAGLAHPSTANYDEISSRKAPTPTTVAPSTATTQRRVVVTTTTEPAAEEPTPTTTTSPKPTTTTAAPTTTTTRLAPTTSTLRPP
jgi:hypothetical protein